MKRSLFGALALSATISIAAVAQTPEEYLDLLIVKVRPEKRADFGAINKKLADANRLNKGDTWMATETTYGENNTVSFVSIRRNHADIEKGYEAFMAAVNKAYGEAGAENLLRDFNGTIVSSRSEIRRRRWDLTANPPADPVARAKILGEARWVYSIIVHVRPGQDPIFEGMVRDVNTAAKKNNDINTPLISQVDIGGQGGTFYISWLMKSLGDVDKLTPLPKMLGEEGYQRFLKAASDSMFSGESMISRFLPELSNPPAEVIAAAPDFWTPKPKMAANP